MPQSQQFSKYNQKFKKFECPVRPVFKSQILRNGPSPWEVRTFKGHLEVKLSKGSGNWDLQFEVLRIERVRTDRTSTRGAPRCVASRRATRHRTVLWAGRENARAVSSSFLGGRVFRSLRVWNEHDVSKENVSALFDRSTCCLFSLRYVRVVA